MKKIFITLSIMLLSAGSLWANGYTVSIKNTKVRKSGDQVLVDFQIDPGKFPQNYRITVVPIIYNDQYQAKTLSPITLVGKKKNMVDRRSDQVLGNRRILTPRNSPMLDYSASIPFEEWMQMVSVSVYQVGEGCNEQYEIPRQMIAEGKLLYYNVTPFFNTAKLDYELTELEKYDLENPFLHPMEDYNKRYDILLKDRDKGTSKVIFKVGSAVIDTDFAGNGDVLNAVGKAFDLIENDPNAILKHIMIAGYASPEGSLALNTRLGHERAEAVKVFLQARMKQPQDELFELYNGREDWDGLRELVEKSDMEDKAEILNIIDSYTIEQEVRKTRLKEFKGGAPYRYMLENFYPPLRSGGYVQVYYEIDRKASVSTAVVDDQGRTTWIDPDSPRNRAVTAINKAIDLMVAHKFDQALAMLAEFKDDPRTWNNIGVCYMMKGDYVEADSYFLKASHNGDADAVKNLEQTGWAQRVEK